MLLIVCSPPGLDKRICSVYPTYAPPSVQEITVTTFSLQIATARVLHERLQLAQCKLPVTADSVCSAESVRVSAPSLICEPVKLIWSEN
jgi:hypothetical protein